MCEIKFASVLFSGFRLSNYVLIRLHVIVKTIKQFFPVYQASLSCINPIISWVNPVLACMYSIVWCVNSILKTEKKNFAGNVHLLVIKTRNNHFPEEIKDFRSVVLWVKSISHRMTIIRVRLLTPRNPKEPQGTPRNPKDT